MEDNVPCLTVETTPFEGQKPGTSGLRKKVTVFQQEHYLANFVQATFDALDGALKGKTLVVSGDGRFYSDVAISTIVRMAAANGVAEVWVGRGGLLSTPAVSAILRTRDQGKASGAFILTASHNPGGPTEDFGIKYNCANGEPAPESLTNAIFEKTRGIGKYYIAEGAHLPVDTSDLGTHDFYVQHAPTPAAGAGSHGGFRLRVIDPVEDYVRLIKTIFDFGALKRLLARPDFSFIFDGMHGVAGPYARRLFVDELGAHPDCLVRCDPRPDFGGGHPDPNLTYAPGLVAAMGLAVPGGGGGGGGHHGDGHPPLAPAANPPAFGAACDGDADRNMILGRRFFVTPSDSVAVLAAHAQAAIPYFRVMGLKGVARSMPTSAALDRVAAALKVPCAEVPTGWKFFGNLMDAGKCSICGEESFGTGSDHVREKDGLWAVLAWLSVLAHANHADGAGAAVQSALGRLGAAVHAATHGGEAGGGGGGAAAAATLTRPADAPAVSTSTAAGAAALVGVEDIVRAHWATYGRNYYTRYDYENVEAEKADAVMAALRAKIGEVTQVRSFVVDAADEFTYTDPVDGSVSAHQGIRFLFTDGSRCVYRLSGTGSSGATIRVYVEQYVPPGAGAEALGRDAAEALAPLVKVALGLADIEKLTGRDAPTVIT